MSRALAALRARSALLADASPRVHLLTSPVALERSADVLLVVGARPSATADPDSVAAFVEAAGALLVNLGMLEREREAAIGHAVAAARALSRPWVLDPVKIGLAAPRLALARRLLALKPAVVKLNRDELAALAEGGEEGALVRLARESGTVVAVTGPEDWVSDGGRLVRIRGGSARLAQVTASGCALGGLVAAFLAVGDRPFDAAVHALAAYAVAARRAAARSEGPGSFWPAMLDALAALRPADVLAEAEVREEPRVDLRLYAVLDPLLARGRSLADLARAAVAGGATLVQLRMKDVDTRSFIETARAVRAALAGTGVPLVVNDRVDVALAAQADGVHLGARDLEPALARTILGPEAILGVTIHHAHEAEALPPGVATYAGLGPVFSTATKDPGTPPLGPAGLARLIAAVRARHPDLPICAIAGIDAANAAEVIEAGADGIAVISALFGAEDVAAAARDLRAAVDAALAQRTKREASE